MGNSKSKNKKQHIANQLTVPETYQAGSFLSEEKKELEKLEKKFTKHGTIEVRIVLF